MSNLLDVCAVIPTAGRRARLIATIRSVLAQELVPAEIVIVDGSDSPWTQTELEEAAGRPAAQGVILKVEIARMRGAGPQRNQGGCMTKLPLVWFLDDDVDLTPGCLSALWQEMEADMHLGGCNAIITNQRYSPPGRIMRRLLSWIGCPVSGSLAGLCRGPAMNFLPTDKAGDSGGETEWMNTTCTLYRRSALPDPPFLEYFHGYSLMEDVALSLEVAKNWRLRSVPKARIYHDTIPAHYKSRVIARQSMEVANRWFVARRVMGCPPLRLFYWLVLLQLIGLFGMLRIPIHWLSIPAWCLGNALGWFKIARHNSDWQGYSPDY